MELESGVLRVNTVDNEGSCDGCIYHINKGTDLQERCTNPALEKAMNLCDMNSDDYVALFCEEEDAEGMTEYFIFKRQGPRIKLKIK